MEHPALSYQEWEILEVLRTFSASNRPEWKDFAKCAGEDTAIFFPGQGQSVDKGKKFCQDCEVRESCFFYAIGEETGDTEDYGVWGGSSSEERISWRVQRLTPDQQWDKMINSEKLDLIEGL
jgi:hypothetical protein